MRVSVLRCVVALHNPGDQHVLDERNSHSHCSHLIHSHPCKKNARSSRSTVRTSIERSRFLLPRSHEVSGLNRQEWRLPRAGYERFLRSVPQGIGGAVLHCLQRAVDVRRGGAEGTGFRAIMMSWCPGKIAIHRAACKKVDCRKTNQKKEEPCTLQAFTASAATPASP
jgi:hypothetical protein